MLGIALVRPSLTMQLTGGVTLHSCVRQKAEGRHFEQLL